MHYHFIAIGGAAMHNLALALDKAGHKVTGSDDHIFEPSRSRLKKAGILPNQEGWFPERVEAKPDAIILGMHAREDNPELAKAKDLGIPIYSYPEFLFHQCQNKKRVVIGGSHGKTSITSMILHALDKAGIETDYMVGAQLEGFDIMVKISDAPLVILEGDEYLTSPIDRKPKFLWYKPHLAVVSGIAWDHINVFPTFENYLEQFEKFRDTVSDKIFYFQGDEYLSDIMPNSASAEAIPYAEQEYEIIAGETFVKFEGESYPMEIFGEHNLQNLEAARRICQELGVEADDFYKHMQSFTGASKRLEKMVEKGDRLAFKDFAHAPSKVKASLKAVRDQYPEKKCIAMLELHTFSSLTHEFLLQYKGSLDPADRAWVYFNPETLKRKKLPELSMEEVQAAFENEKVQVFTDSSEIWNQLKNENLQEAVVLVMTSGNFDGVDIDKTLKEIV